MLVKISTDKALYRPNEPIHLAVQICNGSSTDVFLDNEIGLNMLIYFKDRAGNDVRYPNWNLAAKAQHIRDKSELIQLRPGMCYGCLDLTDGDLRANQPGEYSLFVKYTDVRVHDFAPHLRTVTKPIVSNTLRIHVR